MIKIIERTFDLINNKGEAYPLSRYNTFSGFFGEVEGLGMDHDATYQKLGNVYDLLQDNINQGEISGVVYFQSKYPYQEYARFVEFCQETPLKLRYVNPVGEYYRDGVVSKIEKNEDGSPARVKIVFTASTLWYKEIKVSVDSNSITVVSDSVIDSPCCLFFSGVTKTNANLSWQQTLDNVSIMSGTLMNVTIAATDIVYVRTDTDPYKIYKDTGYSLPDLFGYSDFTTQRFPYLYKGANRFIVSGATNITVEGHILYETV